MDPAGMVRRIEVAWFSLVAAVLAAGCNRTLILSEYGSKTGVSRADDGSVIARQRPHRGVDIKAYSIGDPVIASADGMVLFAIYRPREGTTVMIAHPTFSRFTIYSHLKQASVEANDLVARGDAIGKVGVFPASRKVIHVHWELCTNFLCRGEGHLGGTEDPLARTVGCFDRSKAYPSDALFLTLPVPCDTYVRP